MTDDEPPNPSRALIESIKAGLRLTTSPFARECAETAQRLKESSPFQETLKISRLWRAAYEQARYELDYEVAKTPKAATTPQTNQQSLEERIKAETEAEAVNAEAEKRNAAELELEAKCESTAPAQATTEPPPTPDEPALEEGLAPEAERIKAETEAEIEAVNAEAEKRNAAELELDAPAQATTEPPPTPELKAARCRILAAMVFRAAAARWAPTGREERLALRTATPSSISTPSSASSATREEAPMRFSPLVNDALDVLAESGLTGAVKEGRHYKLQFINQFGCKCLLIIARSPSDRRAFKQSRSQLRRLMRRRS